MRQNISIWSLIYNSLDQNIPIVLLYVLESTGSSPGRQGFFMAINALGEMEGSIGGGIMEHKFVEMAKEKLKTGNLESKVRKQIHDKTAKKDQSGMICSGEQIILLYPVQSKNKDAIRLMIESLEQNKNGTFSISPEGIDFNDDIPEKDFVFDLKIQGDWRYKEKTGFKNQLTIIGGGHCSHALSKLMRAMDFYIQVYDDRKDLKTMLENNAAHKKHYVNDYSELKDLIQPGSNHYVVIMTLGYRTDDLALRAILDKDFKYLGLLGSENKISKMLEEYKKDGLPWDRLQLIHAPVGLQIKSQTPEEIAISIAAEIIGIKNKDL